ncbi:hypothetical protein EYF80_037172 [Liparis tanakae]|uniref:Uncharacterized protein n=1 Tax=Liparis tanakae TaxID=230148 RepID=A0A4Z2GIJ7_9TELE|nr:hypothetical protein EYF80_037172 [Liparis tanakae]
MVETHQTAVLRLQHLGGAAVRVQRVKGLDPQPRVPPSTYFVHRPGSQSLQQPAEHRSILQRRLEESLRVRDALLGGLQDPQRDEPRFSFNFLICLQSVVSSFGSLVRFFFFFFFGGFASWRSALLTGPEERPRSNMSAVRCRHWLVFAFGGNGTSLVLSGCGAAGEFTDIRSSPFQTQRHHRSSSVSNSRLSTAPMRPFSSASGVLV